MGANRRLTFSSAWTSSPSSDGRAGELVRLTPKAFAVLRRLVEDGGHLVSKEELLQPLTERAGEP